METRKRYINLRPAVILTAGLILGIYSIYTIIFNSVLLGVLILSVALIFLSVLLIYYHKRRDKLAKFFIFLIILSVTFGCISTLISTCKGYTESGYSEFNGNVYEIYSETDNGNSYTYSLIVKGDFLSLKNVKAYAELTTNKRLFVGSKVKFSGYFSISKSDEFTFSSGTQYFINVNNETVRVFGVEGVFNKIKYTLFNAYDRYVENTSGINFAVITGDTQYVPIGVLQKYRDIGVAHLFAVSGLHVGLLYGFLILITKPFKISNIKKVAITVITLLFYVAFCGFTSSAVRAFIIIAVREVAKTLGKKPDATTNLAISAYFILLFSPSELMSVGFLLSFSVYLGLILLSRPISELLGKVINEKLAILISSSISAQIVSFPILLHFFGYASLFSFVFNLFIIPLIAFFFPIFIVCAVMLVIFPTASVFTVIPNLFFLALNYLLSLADTSIFMVRGLQVTLSVVPFYLLLYTLTGKINFTKKQKNTAIICLAIVTTVAFIAQNFV